MKKSLIVLLAIVVIAAAGFLIFSKSTTTTNVNTAATTTAEQTPEVTSQPRTFTVAEGDLQFTYTDGSFGYTLTEPAIPASDTSGVVHRIVLMPTTDYLDQKNRVGGEASPAWTVDVYENTKKQSPGVWADANTLQSNIKLAQGEISEEVIAGANAAAYTIDGLYPATVHVIAHGGFIYVVTAAYLDKNSPTFQGLDAWLETFTFAAPAPATTNGNAKIDPKVACESALAYMTFDSAAAADAFVAACINGEHPEVIERYKAGFQIDGAAL